MVVRRRTLFTYRLVALFLLFGLCESNRYATLNWDYLNKARGDLEVSVEISTSFSLNEGILSEFVSKNALDICLVSATNVNPDEFDHQCTKTKLISQKIQPKLNFYLYIQKFNPVRLPIFEQTSSTYFIIVKPSNGTNDGSLQNESYWTFLPSVFPNSGNNQEVTLSPRTPETITNQRKEISAALSLVCSPGYFGSLCAVQCQPPNERYRCDEMTGELKCAENWRGRNCDQNDFLSLRSKHKRASNEDITAESTKRIPCASVCVKENTIRCDDNFGGDYTCHCKSGYRGSECQFDQGPSYSSLLLTRTLLATIIPVVVISLFITLFCCWSKRKAAARRTLAASRRTQPRNYQNTRMPTRITSPTHPRLYHMQRPISTTDNRSLPRVQPVSLNTIPSRVQVGDLLAEISETLTNAGIEVNLNPGLSDNISVNFEDLNLGPPENVEPEPPAYYEAEPPSYEELPPSYEKAISKSPPV